MNERPGDVEEHGDDPNDPSHPDFDLSEAGGPIYHYETGSKPWFLRRGFLVAVAVAVIASLIIPILPR